MGLEGALRKPGAVARPAAWPPATTPPMLDDLEAMVNLQEDLLAPPTGTGHPDPIISPPLYGRWHAIVDRLDVEGAGWVHELNRDPRLRVPAGYGAEVIATGADGYMARAWAQLGDLPDANQRIRQAQLGLAAAKSLHRRHLTELERRTSCWPRPASSTAASSPRRPASTDTAVTLRSTVDASRLTRAATSTAIEAPGPAAGPAGPPTAPGRRRATPAPCSPSSTRAR